MPITVRKVNTKADMKRFMRFPWQLIPNYPHWVPEIPLLRRETLNKEKHTAWDYLTGEYFIAVGEQNQTLGTIAAFVNHRHNKIHDEQIGFFGFFDCVNDQAAANALFEAAETYLRSQNVTAIRGPASFTSNELYGMLAEGFDQDAMMLMPYNPPYYLKLVEGYGFEKVMDLYSWREEYSNIPAKLYEEDGSEKRVVRATRRSMERHNIKVRTLDTKNKAEDFKTLRDLYHNAWEKNWGFLTMTDRELDDLVENLGYLVMPQYTFFGTVGDKPAGFLLMIPNLNEAIQPVNPKPGWREPFDLLRIGWHWKIRPKITSIRAILMGVAEEYRGIGVEAAMHLAFAEYAMTDTKLTWGEASWVLETNTNTNKLLEHFGAHIHRKHRLYQKTL